MKMPDVPSSMLVAPEATTRHAPASHELATASLADLDVGAFATIHAVMPSDDGDAELVMRLIEIGFVPGERVRIVAVGRPGREPIAVRLAATDSGRRAVNGATFAMRRYEAGLVRVVPDLSVDPAR